MRAEWSLLCVRDNQTGKAVSLPEDKMNAVYVINRLSLGEHTLLSIPKTNYMVPILVESFEFVDEFLILHTADLIYTFELYFEEERVWY